MRQAPFWKDLEAIASPLAYDDAVLAGGQVPTDLLAHIPIPVLVVCGTAAPEWFRDAGRAMAAALPHGRYETLDGQDHRVDPAVLAPVPRTFFG